MFRRLLTMMTLLLMLPVLALAESTPVYQIFTFSGRLPEMLQEPLSALIPDESRILSGAAIQHNGYATDTPEPSYDTSYSALVLVNLDEGLRLYAAARPEGLPWEINDYTPFLRQGKNVSVSIYQPEVNRIPVFSVDYAAKSGSVSDLFVFWSNRLWCVKGHIDPLRGTTIDNHQNALTLTDALGREKFWCSTPFYMEYMTDISAFPTSREACRALSGESVYGLPSAGSVVYAKGANLRTDPTGKSESLGVYADNTPMLFTGEQSQGSAWPWYQVQIGNTVGWMSSNYVGHQPDYSFFPITLGRTTAACALFSDPAGQQPSVELPAGATFHILTEYRGMYHICVPSGELSWAVDVNGLYGYIPKEGVLAGASPSALDALENAR